MKVDAYKEAHLSRDTQQIIVKHKEERKGLMSFLALEDVLWLLQVDELPVAPDQIPWVISVTEDFVKKNGLKWIHEHRDRLVWELTQF